MIMFGLTVIPAKVKEIVDVLEEGFVDMFEETAKEDLVEALNFYNSTGKEFVDFFSTIDLSNSHDEDVAAIIAHNKRMERHIKGYQIVIDALTLAISRSEKRKDIDYIAKKRKYLGLTGMLERGKACYVPVVVKIPECRMQEYSKNS